MSTPKKKKPYIPSSIQETAYFSYKSSPYATSASSSSPAAAGIAPTSDNPYASWASTYSASPLTVSPWNQTPPQYHQQFQSPYAAPQTTGTSYYTAPSAAPYPYDSYPTSMAAQTSVAPPPPYSSAAATTSHPSLDSGSFLSSPYDGGATTSTQQHREEMSMDERKLSFFSPSKTKKRKLIIIPRKPTATTGMGTHDITAAGSLHPPKPVAHVPPPPPPPPPPQMSSSSSSASSSSSSPFVLSFSSTVAQSWNESLRNYVQRALKEGKSEEQKRKIDEELRIFIAHAEQSGFLDKDWTHIPLPPACRDVLKSKDAEDKEKQGFDDGIDDDDRSIELWSKKRKTMSQPEPDIRFQRKERWDVPQPAAPKIERVMLSLDELQKLSATAGKKSSKIKKMGKSSSLSSKPGYFGIMDDVQQKKHDITNVIVGRSVTLERPFLRLTGDPDPNVVRPLRVLQKAFDLVMRKYSVSHDYLYAFEQLKSIRQDIMIQRIENDFAVRVYETHARISIEFKDVKEYEQCDAVLCKFYGNHLTGNENEIEFLSYRLLHNLLPHRYAVYQAHRSQITRSMRSSVWIRDLLALEKAWARSNIDMFFRVYRSVQEGLRHMVEIYISSIRKEYASSFLRVMRGPVSIDRLAQAFGFETNVDMHDFFLEQWGLEDVDTLLTGKSFVDSNTLYESLKAAWKAGESKSASLVQTRPSTPMSLTSALSSGGWKKKSVGGVGLNAFPSSSLSVPFAGMKATGSAMGLLVTKKKRMGRKKDVEEKKKGKKKKKHKK